MAWACYHLGMRKFSLPSVLTVLAAACVFTACSPKFDWRDYRSVDAPYIALFPGKPSTHTRTIDLDGLQVSMTMTASDVDGSTFAVGSALLPDAAMAPAALAAMKTALINNIGATINGKKTSSGAADEGTPASDKQTNNIEARGVQHGTPMLLVGRFLARDKYIYQVIVLAKETQVSRENIDMFIASFKLN
jgi:hypothetical protein